MDIEGPADQAASQLEPPGTTDEEEDEEEEEEEEDDDDDGEEEDEAESVCSCCCGTPAGQGFYLSECGQPATQQAAGGHRDSLGSAGCACGLARGSLSSAGAGSPRASSAHTVAKQVEAANEQAATPATTDESVPSEPERQEREAALNKRRYVLNELIETERDYVADLGKIVEGYLEEIRRQLVDSGVADILTTGVVVPQAPVAATPATVELETAGGEPPEVQTSNSQQQQQQTEQASQPEGPKLPEALKDGKHKIIFGNIEAIFEFHRDHFLLELERCRDEPQRLGPLFKRYERRLNMYVVYCQNKPRSELIVSEYLDTYFEELRIKLGHKLQLPDLLIKPVQRIMKYQLLLKDILRYTERAGLQRERQDLVKAVEIMLVVPKAADDMMNVGRLTGFPGKLTAQGKLIKQGIIYFVDLTPLIRQQASLEPAQLAQLVANPAPLGAAGPRSGRRATVQSAAGASVSGPASGELGAGIGAGPTVCQPLSCELIGGPQMDDSRRLLLNQLLMNEGQVKLRERQTFLFEQTIIFSEVARLKSGSSGQAGAPHHARAAAPTAGQHPCQPHAHAPGGWPEFCCSGGDCASGQPQGTLCDRSPEAPACPAHHHHHYPPGKPTPQGPTGELANGAASIPHYHSMPTYHYKNHLSINKVALIDRAYGPRVDAGQLRELLGANLDADLESRRFMLRSRDPNQENVIYLLQTGCALDRDDWVCSIRSMLECQLDFLRALQSPIAYQRGLNKDGLPDSWNPELRKTLSNPSSGHNNKLLAGQQQQTPPTGAQTLAPPPSQLQLQLKFAHQQVMSSPASQSPAGFGRRLFSGGLSQRPGSVKASAGMLVSSSRALSMSSSGSSSGSGQAKYLRYVRSKLSKSRLLSLSSASGQEEPTVGPETRDPQAQDRETGGAGHEQANAELELVRLECRQHLVSSSSVELAGAVSRLALTSEQSNQQPGREPVNKQTTRDKRGSSHNFFQGFRYTLRGRRTSKQSSPDSPACDDSSPADLLQTSQTLTFGSSSTSTSTSTSSTTTANTANSITSSSFASSSRSATIKK